MLPRLAWFYQQAMRNYRLGPEELRDLQNRRLRRIVGFAYENVAYYHRIMKDSGVRPDDVRTVEDLPKIPPMSKDDVRQHFGAGLSPSNAAVGLRRQTSGSTGNPLRIVRGKAYADLQMAIKLRKLIIAGARPWWKGVIFQFPYSQYFDGRQTAWAPNAMQTILFGSFETQLAVLRLYKVVYRDGHFDKAARMLALMKPDVIDAKTIILRRLGHYLKENGLEFKVKVGFLGEIRSEACRRDLVDLFQMDTIVHTYGATEFGYLGSECTEGSGVHMSADVFVTETMRVDEIAAPGERGEVLITCLYNNAMPLIRYRLGDIVTRAKEEVCGCGSWFPRLTAIDGRQQDRLVTKTGDPVAPSIVVNLMENALGLYDYQVTQTGPAKVLVKLRSQDNSAPRREVIDKEMREILGDSLEVEFDTWESVDIPQRYRPVVGLAG